MRSTKYNDKILPSTEGVYHYQYCSGLRLATHLIEGPSHQIYQSNAEWGKYVKQLADKMPSLSQY